MKTYVLTIIINLIIVSSIQGKIRNGYDPQLVLAYQGLENLKTLLEANTALTVRERARVRRHILRHEQYIKYHELTSRLLFEFMDMAGDLFSKMDTIRDRQGRPVDVYVKLVPAGGLLLGDLAGSANLSQGSDIDTYYSHYGMNTASINVATGRDAIFILAHELGHLLHQIPNASTYRIYFDRIYRHAPSRCMETGHSPGDPSGQSAIEYEKLCHVRYGKHRKAYK